MFQTKTLPWETFDGRWDEVDEWREQFDWNNFPLPNRLDIYLPSITLWTLLHDYMRELITVGNYPYQKGLQKIPQISNTEKWGIFAKKPKNLYAPTV
ncbi:MAG: hypothetical protein FWC98_05175 [Bacteroidales bacterium]|nr:hypothetical protein [Bacteroidales bacterium]